VSLPIQGLATSTSTLTAPGDAPSVPDTSRTDNIRACSTSFIDSPSTSVPWGTATGYKELKGTMSGSPALATDGTSMGKCGVSSSAQRADGRSELSRYDSYHLEITF
jgi:hypothetical protein